MAAPNKNQLWKLRSKHGSDKLFASSELLWTAACEYFDWCESHPLLEVSIKGKDNAEVTIPKMRPFTLRGLCLYLSCDEGYINQLESSLQENDDDKSQDLVNTITRIRDVIYTQNLEAAAVGLFSYNIIARVPGLTEKPDGRTDNQPSATLHIQVTGSNIPLSNSEDAIKE